MECYCDEGWWRGGEGKEGWKERRERRWREIGDIMSDEDVMEISVMHLCIPDYELKEKKKDGLILPSWCSLHAVSVLLNEISDWKCTYHFPVYDINEQPSNVVIIRNLPSKFDLKSAGDELKSMIENVCPIVSIKPAISPYSIRHISYGVVKVTLHNREVAVNVAEGIDGREFHGMCLSASVKGKKREGKKEGEGGVEGM